MRQRERMLGQIRGEREREGGREGGRESEREGRAEGQRDRGGRRNGGIVVAFAPGVVEDSAKRVCKGDRRRWRRTEGGRTGKGVELVEAVSGSPRATTTVGSSR